MGVVSSYCQICGLPVQQDHYVADGDGDAGGWLIWRGPRDAEGAPAFPFGPEHAWLRDAVGLRLDDGEPRMLVEGEVHDGVFTDDGAFVWDGLDDRAALHRYCWTAAGRPGSWAELQGHELPAEPEPYREQLFDFEAFNADGHAWMLADPAGPGDDAGRSRRRIAALLSTLSAAESAASHPGP